ncbi:MAG: apolipoprotein N-acyltransferase [Planctomycetota bacterium]
MNRIQESTTPKPKRHRPPADLAPGFAIETHRGVALLALFSALLQSVIFAPISVWPVAFVCLVPWLILTARTTQAPRVYFYSYVLGLASFLINMRWMYVATGWGYLALALYQAAYFPLVACPVRHAVRRRHWPLAVAFPLIWTGSEMLRAVVISGFPWFYLSHSLYGVLTFIQVSDLVGAYGVSFVVAAVNGAIADVILVRLSRKDPSPLEGRNATKEGAVRFPVGRVRGETGDVTLSPTLSLEGRGGFQAPARSARFSVVFAVVLVAATVIYGQVQLHRDTTTEGPKVAVIQGDYLVTVDGNDATDREKMRTYFSMIDAAAKEKPDLFLLPETPWIMYLNPEARDFFQISRESFARFQRYATRNNAYLVTGSASLVQTPYDLLAQERRYNSATVFRPDGSEPERYDKVHLVYFGEVVPFRFGRLRSVYFWLNRLMPFSGGDNDFEYSLFPGDAFRSFTMKAASQPGRSYRFGVPICYEDVMPYVSREFVSGGSNKKRVDFLLNISNDGWYGHGTQQPQHLAICVFRAVENRVGVARAVTTGVSAFIDPSGGVHDRVGGDPSHRWPGESGYATARISVDSRYSLYSRYGDWFAWGCALVWLLVYVDYWIARARALAAE